MTGHFVSAKLGVSVLDHEKAASAEENLRFYFERAFSVKPANTQKAYRSDLNSYVAFCQNHGHSPFHSDIKLMQGTIDAYLDYLMPKYKSSTIKRKLNIIRVMLDVMDLPDPLGKRAFKEYVQHRISSKQDSTNQAEPIMLHHIQAALDAGWDDYISLRNLTILNVGFDTLGRASELARLKWRDIDWTYKAISFRYTKGDKSGEDDWRHLSDTSLKLLTSLKNRTQSIFVFSTESGGNSPLHYNTLWRAYKKALERAGLSQEEAARYSAHGTRVGTALEMRSRGIDTAAIQQAGGWKSPSMVLRYTKRIDLQHSGAVRLSKVTSR